ncbi:MAG: 3'(2'),5'-bisphosphate nucleotidase [Planctomycetaceae bacterium]
MAFAKELEVGLAAVRLAARVCQSVQASITGDVLDKQDKSPVTVADFASQAVICRALQQAFPHDPVISEEEADALNREENSPFRDRILKELAAVGIEATPEELSQWVDHGSEKSPGARFWTLDPIDGTKGFVRGDQYAVSLALIVEGEIQVAVLGCPNLPGHDGWDKQRGALFSAVRGEGAQLRPLAESAEHPQSVRVSSTRKGSFARLCESVESGHSAHSDSARIAALLGISNDPVRLDSQAKYAVVARGEADIYLRLPTKKDYREKIWDHAGGVLVVEEAGGKVTDVDGKPLDFQQGSELRNNRGVVVTNGGLHAEVLSAVAAVLGGETLA